MQFIFRIAISMILMSAAYAAYQSSAKLRRDGVLNLFPFPRVGRSQNTWMVPISDNYSAYKPSEKRQLYAFPRVGRSGAHLPRRVLFLPETVYHKRAEENSDSTGMWFGPRLGRAYNGEEVTFPPTEQSEPEYADPEVIERKKRQSNQ